LKGNIIFTMDYYSLGISLGGKVSIVIAFSALLCLALVLFIFAVRQYLLRNKAEEEYAIAQMNYESSNMQLLASEEELNRQFLEIKEQKEKLKVSRERYKLAVEGAEVGIWDVDIAKGEVYISKKGKEIVGFENCNNSIITLEKIKDKIIKADRGEVTEKFYKHLQKESETFEVMCRIQVANEKYSWVNIRGRAMHDKDGNPIRIAGSLNNINKEKLTEARINKLAYYDSLTDLPNRAYFNQLMEEYIQIQQVEKFALFLIDIDNFKAINESLGHSYGDEIINNVAELLKVHLKENTELIRFGGDEFVFVVSHVTTNAELKAYAEQIIREFAEPFTYKEVSFSITLSMGISTYPFDGKQADELLKHADMALYDVKVNGKNGYKMFSFELDECFNKRLTLERDLRQAIIKEEFELYYQPKLDIKLGRVLGYEALIRWNHPQKGMIFPMDFIPFAEETGLIIPLGEWVICQSVRQLKEWHDQGHNELTIAINLSAKQFKDVHLIKLFKRISMDTDVDITKLELEITESTALYDMKFAIQVLKELKKLGLKLSLDDFGTGYSSLNYLTQLPIDHLKIDKSFINNTIEHKSGEEIIKSVISLAHACNLKVIAEGVETKKQLDFLREENCDMIQGYYISRPVPRHEALEFMQFEYTW
jgi:diguanylate cyclase (GGDEF)-like protein/PAS domain S-box-containing protein